MCWRMAAGGLGVATQAYWQLLLAQVKPLPRFFSQLDFAVAADTAAKVRNSCPCLRDSLTEGALDTLRVDVPTSVTDAPLANLS